MIQDGSEVAETTVETTEDKDKAKLVLKPGTPGDRLRDQVDRCTMLELCTCPTGWFEYQRVSPLSSPQ